jgi:hypothetical protein
VAEGLLAQLSGSVGAGGSGCHGNLPGQEKSKLSLNE